MATLLPVERVPTPLDLTFVRQSETDFVVATPFHVVPHLRTVVLDQSVPLDATTITKTWAQLSATSRSLLSQREKFPTFASTAALVRTSSSCCLS